MRYFLIGLLFLGNQAVADTFTFFDINAHQYLTVTGSESEIERFAWNYKEAFNNGYKKLFTHFPELKFEFSETPPGITDPSAKVTRTLIDLKHKNFYIIEGLSDQVMHAEKSYAKWSAMYAWDEGIPDHLPERIETFSRTKWTPIKNQPGGSLGLPAQELATMRLLFHGPSAFTDKTPTRTFFVNETAQEIYVMKGERSRILAAKQNIENFRKTFDSKSIPSHLIENIARDYGVVIEDVTSPKFTAASPQEAAEILKMQNKFVEESFNSFKATTKPGKFIGPSNAGSQAFGAFARGVGQGYSVFGMGNFLQEAAKQSTRSQKILANVPEVVWLLTGKRAEWVPMKSSSIRKAFGYAEISDMLYVDDKPFPIHELLTGDFDVLPMQLSRLLEEKGIKTSLDALYGMKYDPKTNKYDWKAKWEKLPAKDQPLVVPSDPPEMACFNMLRRWREADQPTYICFRYRGETGIEKNLDFVISSLDYALSWRSSAILECKKYKDTSEAVDFVKKRAASSTLIPSGFDKLSERIEPYCQRVEDADQTHPHKLSNRNSGH